MNKFDTDVFKTEGTILLSKICNIKVVTERKFTIYQHISREKHVNVLKLVKIKNEKPQQFLNDVLNNSYLFNNEFYVAMLSVNIPFNKLKNELLCKFSEK